MIPTPSESNPTDQKPQTTEAFTEHAKWLIDWHGKRSDAFATRASALLGFAGVILALLLNGARVPGLNPNPWFWATLVVTATLLVASAATSLATISSTETIAPRTAQVRRWWQRYTSKPKAGDWAENIAETFLRGTDLNKKAPVDAAVLEADRRAFWFRWATSTLLVGLIGVFFLLLQVFAQVR